jgi:hypothetical protein
MVVLMQHQVTHNRALRASEGVQAASESGSEWESDAAAAAGDDDDGNVQYQMEASDSEEDLQQQQQQQSEDDDQENEELEIEVEELEEEDSEDSEQQQQQQQQRGAKLQPARNLAPANSSRTGACKPSEAALAAATAAAAAPVLHSSEAAAAKHIAEAYLSLPEKARQHVTKLLSALLCDGLLWKGQMLIVMGYVYGSATQGMKGVFEVIESSNKQQQLTLQCKTCQQLLRGKGLWDEAEQHCNRLSHHVSECVMCPGVLNAAEQPSRQRAEAD